MTATELVIAQLRAEDGKVTAQIVKDLIEEHTPIRVWQKSLYDRYKADDVPIQHRKFTDKNKINRKLNNDYFSDIVDTKVGYFAGNPISYQLDKTNFTQSDQLNESLYDEQSTIIDEWKIVNNIEDLDGETAKMAAICGTASRLNFIDQSGTPRTVNIYPWECIFIGDGSTGEDQYAMRYYRIKIKRDNQWVEVWKVEWYDRINVSYYLIDDDGNFEQDKTEEKNPLLHMFPSVPLIEFPNNEERMSDGEKVLELIDGYDRTLSDVNSEIEQFRLAYMAFYGVEPDEETVDLAQRTGAFFFPNPQAGDKAEFITKDLNDAVIEHHLDRLDNNIYKFSKTPNFSDESFAGSQSGEARKYKMLPFESKCIITERKFTASLRKQFRLLAHVWNDLFNAKFDWKDVYFEFKRNFPLDLNYEAEATGKLRGHVSEHTRLSLLSFVDDVKWEIETMQSEREGYIDLDDVDEVVEDESES